MAIPLLLRIRVALRLLLAGRAHGGATPISPDHRTTKQDELRFRAACAEYGGGKIVKEGFPNASESFRKLNPQLFGALGAMGSAKRQQNKRRESEDSGVESVPASVGYRVTLISCRRKLVDAHDNLRTGAKPLVDRITQWLGFASDSDPRIEWCYEQFRTRGTTGTIVLIERR